MNTSFGYITAFEYRLKAATAEVMAFKSGEKYVRMQEEYRKELRLLEHRIRELEEELSLTHSETITVRNQWFEVFKELEKESSRKLDISRKQNRQMEKRALDAERRLDTLQDKATQQRRRIYELETTLEEERGKI